MNSYNSISANNLCNFIYKTPNTDNINNCALIIDALNKNNYPLKDFYIVTDTKSNISIIKKLNKTEHFAKYEDISPAVFLEDLYNNCKDLLIQNGHKNIAEDLQYAADEKFIEQEELENNIRQKDITYNSLFEDKNINNNSYNINWNNLSTFEKAAIACEYNIEHNYCDISKVIELWNKNPETANTKFNFDTLENTRKNVKKIIAPFYKAFETHYNIELNPPKYYMESMFINDEHETNKLDKILKETRYSDDLEALKQLSEKINKHRPNHLLSEIRTYNTEHTILYEKTFNRTIDYQNKVYNGKVDAAEFTKIYNSEKTINSQTLKEN
ncbi:MAG: hypothetical protein K6E78_07725, partial [Treponema sp.]|nr:hypothetical protein [Treponema sp.]